ncbi:MAG: heat shock protein transcriptional repressor HspR [Acidimicrobiales bacterium]
MPEYRQAVYVISVAAELAGCHPQTLRIYERKGLVQPARTGGGSRRYSEADIELLQKIQELTNQGMNLVGVQRVLELEARIGQLESQIGALQEQVDDTHDRYRREIVPFGRSPLPPRH